jgi:histidinol dehydrogenase
MQLLKSTAPDFSAQLKRALGTRGEEVDVAATVREILITVQNNGDAAVRNYTAQFDKHTLGATLALSQDFIAEKAALCRVDVQNALSLAATRIRSFHAKQSPQPLDYTDEIGVRLGLEWSLLDSVGIYVPGGTASYPSSVLMNALPAVVAGVERIVMVVPTPNGVIKPSVLYAAQVAGVTEIYPIGGAQAVAALAFGTETIKPVDKIVGPGNAFVAEAKRQVFGRVGIDSIAGPSEILVIADKHNNPQWIAWDLLSQAEHDASAQSILITDDAEFAGSVVAAVEKISATLPRREIAVQSWQQHGVVILVDNIEESIAIANTIAAEHLEICVENPRALAAKIRHAGSVFIGKYTPEAIGDYIGGANHVLPTNQTARFASGLSVYDFLKRTTYLECSADALQVLGQPTVTLAEEEGLHAHAGSVAVRLNLGFTRNA